jgi:hypothetical protein
MFLFHRNSSSNWMHFLLKSKETGPWSPWQQINVFEADMGLPQNGLPKLWILLNDHFPYSKNAKNSRYRSNTTFLGRHRKIILWFMFLDTFEQFFHNSSSVSRLCSPGLELMPLGTPFDVDLSNKATKKHGESLRDLFFWDMIWVFRLKLDADVYWLVVSTFRNIWVRQLGWWHSWYMESHKIPWFQTTNQSFGRFFLQLHPIFWNRSPNLSTSSGKKHTSSLRSITFEVMPCSWFSH